MKIFSRYILNEVVQHAAIGVSLFTFVIFMRDLGRLLEIVVRDSAPLPSVAELFFLTLPVACTITIPMGLLVGILIGLSRLAADSEVTAMRASGLGAWMFVRIISVFAVAAWIIALANSIWLAPMSSAALARLELKLRSSQASFEIQPRVFYEDFKNMVLYVEDVRATSNASVWRGVFLADVSDPSAPSITMARSGLMLFLRRGMWGWAKVLTAAADSAPEPIDRRPSASSTQGGHGAVVHVLATIATSTNHAGLHEGIFP